MADKSKNNNLTESDKKRGINPDFIEKQEITVVKCICTQCWRNLYAPLFDGCMNRNCPHGFTPCL